MNSVNSAVKRLVFLCAVFTAFTVGVNAQNLSAAKILSFQGSVQISRGATSRIQFKVNDTILTGDIVKTGAGSRLVLGLADGSQAIISENTTVEIKDTSAAPRTIFNVIRGKTRIRIEKMGGKPNPYRVTTPTTVIAVRGTVFDVFVKGDRTEVFVQEGEVSVSNLLFPAQEIILVPGQFTRVMKDLTPLQPAPFKPERNEEFFRPNRRGDGRDGDNDNGGGQNGPGRNNPPRRNSSPNDSPQQQQQQQGDPRRRPNEPNRENSPSTPPRRPGGSEEFLPAEAGAMDLEDA